MKTNVPTSVRIQILGTGTWNDEDYVMLLPEAKRAGRARTAKRAHLRREISAAMHTLAKDALENDNRVVIVAFLMALKTGEVDPSGQSRDKPLDAIAQDIIATGGTEWTVATYSDHNRGGTKYYFEVSLIRFDP